MMKLMIKNAAVCDGTGAPCWQGDIGVRFDGSIAAVGVELSHADCEEVFDAGGLVVAPGFIDAHSHSDVSILADPQAFGKLSQGVTTEIVGNCGLSAFPVTGYNRAHLEELWSSYGVRLAWTDHAGYMRELKRRGVHSNIVSLVGHNTLRAAVAGYTTRKLSPTQLQIMADLLRVELAQGAIGMSTGLLYVPGIFSTPEELSRLLEVVAARDGIYATHLRSEGNALLEAAEEAVKCCTVSGQRRLHISHLKTAGAINHHKLLPLLQLLQGSDLTVTADRYAYTEGMTSLSVIVPDDWRGEGDAELRTRLQNADEYARLLEEVQLARTETYFQTVRLVNTKAADYARFSGWKFPDIAAEVHRPCAQILLEILREDAPDAMGAFSGMSEENLRTIARQPWVVGGSDESARPRDFRFGRSHPRGFGNFPRFIRLLMDLGFPLETAVHRVTGATAQVFGLTRVGRIQPGYRGDLVAFDPAKLQDRADFAHPHRQAAGIAAVWVMGEHCL